MKANEIWNKFSKENNIESSYQAWSFGVDAEDADNLANLVLKGEKTGTSSAYDSYLQEKEPLPKEGDYSIILDSKNNAVCIIKTIKVEVIPFNEVTEMHAFKEGEGDKSLAYWRQVHEEFFKNLCIDFNYNMKVVYEHFEVVYI